MMPVVSKEEYDNYISKVKKGTERLNFNHAFELICGVFCMSELNGSRDYVIDSIGAFIRACYKYFPAGSECYNMAKEIVKTYYMVHSKNEYVACYKRGTEMSDATIEYRPRAEVEYDEDYIQLVGSGIPYISPSFDGKSYYVFMFVLDTRSDMKGNVTFPGGHVQYDADKRNETIDDICIHGATRELNEELGIDVNDLKYTGNLFSRYFDKGINSLGRMTFRAENVSDPRSISHYHTGLCYTFMVDIEKAQNLLLEEGKTLILYTPWPYETTVANEIRKPLPIYHSIEEIEKETGATVDDWLKGFISKADALCKGKL